MNYRSLVLVCALSCAPGVALEAAPTVPGDDASKSEQARLAPAQLDELLAPIALYPDPLIAIILPASTFPADVVLAARYLKAGGSADDIDAQPWDDSVKSLARYPDVLKWMDENLAWTSQVGSAFALQPADLLTCTQRLRAAARAAGNLTTTPEQHVVVERETIRIVPARTEVIYVPVYDPIVVYRPRTVNFYHPGPIIRFSTGYRTGIWLSYHCDWGYRNVVVIQRPHRVHVWHNYPRWSCPPPTATYCRDVWRPSPSRVHTARYDSRPSTRAVANPSRQNLAAVREPTSQPSRPVRPSSVNTITQQPNPVASPVTTTDTGTRPSSPTGVVTPRPSRLTASDRLPTAQNARAAANPLPRAEQPTRSERRSQGLTLSPLPSASPSPASPAPALSPAPSRRIQAPTTNPAASGFRTPAPAPQPSNRNSFRGNETSSSATPSNRNRASQTLSAPAAAENSGNSSRLSPAPRSRPSSTVERSAAAPVEGETSSARLRRNQ